MTCTKLLSNVLGGRTISCGHVRKARQIHDGKSHSDPRTWESYRAMLRRCYDETHPYYKDYGGRGISVYFEWLGPDGFTQFLKDMGARPLGKTLDREEVNGNYGPDNCRWATGTEQRLNQRRMKK